MDIEVAKQKYEKLWKESQGDEKLFAEMVKLKEKEKKIREQLLMKTERERKREARALIILSKIIIRERPELIRQIMSTHQNEFIQKEGREELDYSTYIMRLLPEHTTDSKPPVRSESGSQILMGGIKVS